MIVEEEEESTESVEATENDLDFENILSSRGRVKILKLLALNIEMNISRIMEETALNHTSVISHLNYLVKIGFIQEKKYGRIKIYRFREENLKAKALQNLIKFWQS
jgi:predicted transcriptional regulator